MTLLSDLWAKVLAIGAVVGAVLLAIFKIRQSGRDAERAEQARREVDAMRTANEVQAGIDRSNDTELERLRRKWTVRK